MPTQRLLGEAASNVVGNLASTNRSDLSPQHFAFRSNEIRAEFSTPRSSDHGVAGSTGQWIHVPELFNKRLTFPNAEGYDE
jgi:hypothetical protein